MTIDEAIQHCEDVAKRCCNDGENMECGNEHKQLAMWLRELKSFRENSNKGDMND